MAVSFLRIKSGQRAIYPLFSMLQSFRLNSKNKDSIEGFVTNLTQRRHEKFKVLKRENMRRNQLQVTAVEGNGDVIEQIHKCLDIRDEDQLTSLIDSWLSQPNNKLPRSIMLEVLEFASETGNEELFLRLIAHAKQHESAFYFESFTFIENLHLELDWRTNKNIDQLIEKFELLYKKSIYDEALTKQMEKLCSIMFRDAVERKSESVVVKLRDKLEQMCQESNDYSLLYVLWRNLFESFWFSDQQIASELIAKHQPLRRLLSKELSFLCFCYLRDENAEQVNRLIEIFLQANMMRQVQTLVLTLLDYECWRKNINAALQIVHLCVKLDIQLSDHHNRRFLNLLLNQPHDKPTEPPDAKKITIKKYQFKF